MERIRIKKSENAQGLVEFALVLPILLLVILGVFAFGHMFFAYTSVVSASREAARYGAVVGQGSGGRLRYRDCDGIRAAAERVGRFAGVTSAETSEGYEGDDPGVFIAYDHGPTDTAGYGDCPAGGAGVDTLELGDRIRVRVTVQYQPIVPLVNIPTFPLSATTARTIIKDVEVGEAPTAVPMCRTSTVRLLPLETTSAPPSLPWNIVVGETITPRVAILVSDGSTASGTVTITDGTNTCNFAAPSNEGLSGCEFAYYDIGDYSLTITFDSSNETLVCSIPEDADDDPYVLPISVLPAPTEIFIEEITPEPSYPTEIVTVFYRMRPLTPGGGTPTGLVTVTASQGSSTLECESTDLTLNEGWYEGYCQPNGVWISNKTYRVSATYDSDTDNYLDSGSPSVDHQVLQPPPTPEPGESEWCQTNRPTLGGPSFSGTGFTVGINRTTPAEFRITQITVQWPDLPTETGDALLRSIRFNGNDLWSANNSNQYRLPPSHTISPNNNNALGSGGNSVVFDYSPATTSGAYSVTMQFTNGTGGSAYNCSVSVSGNRP